MQSLCHSNSDNSDLRNMAEVIGQAMDWVQSCLPSHVYVAFATNLMKEGSTKELRSKAVQLIAERCSSLTPTQTESTLFVEMVPALAELLDEMLTILSTTQYLLQSMSLEETAIQRNMIKARPVPAQACLLQSWTKLLMLSASRSMTNCRNLLRACRFRHAKLSAVQPFAPPLLSKFWDQKLFQFSAS